MARRTPILLGPPTIGAYFVRGSEYLCRCKAYVSSRQYVIGTLLAAGDAAPGEAGQKPNQ